MHDPEDEQNAILDDNVVHHPIVADPEAMERVVYAPDRLDRLPCNPTGPGCAEGELLERPPDAAACSRLELPKGTCGRRRESNVEWLSRAHAD